MKRIARSSDYIVDGGAGAGVHGGEMICKGTTQALLGNPPDRSLTGKYLNGELSVPRLKCPLTPTESILPSNAPQKTISDIDILFPLGKFITVTGVFGERQKLSGNRIPFIHRRVWRSNSTGENWRNFRGWGRVRQCCHRSEPHRKNSR